MSTENKDQNGQNKGVTTPAPEGAKEQMVSLSLTDVMALIKTGKQEGITDSMIKKLAAAINPEMADNEMLSEEEIKPEDYLDEPVLYYAKLKSFTILGEKRYGMQVRPPHGVIRFKPYMMRKIIKNGRTEVEHTCVAEIQLKSEMEWLEKSPRFNIFFFKKIGETMSFDVRRTDALQTAYSSLSGKKEVDIRAHATRLDIANATTGDIESVRHMLIEKLADANMAHGGNYAQTPLVGAKDLGNYDALQKRGAVTQPVG